MSSYLHRKKISMEFNSIGRVVREGANPETVVDTGNVMFIM